MKRMPKISMRLFFICFVTVELLLINACAVVVLSLLSRFFPGIHDISDITWLLIVSTIMGSALTTLLVRLLFDPILRLGKAMERVAKGDYDVHLSTLHAFREIRQIYSDFNSMTKELSSLVMLLKSE